MKVFATFLLMLASAVAVAGEAQLRVAGIYSSLHYGEESGDLTGWEILVTPRASGGYNAVIQLAEGGEPMLMMGVLAVNGDKILLTVPAGQLLSGKYNGTISATELNLVTPSGPVVMKRGKSYWQ